MKYFPFKILILCVFLPPVLYLFSVQSIERYLHGKYLSEIENTYVGDTGPLFNGSIDLKEAIAKNITRYFQTKKILAWGVKARLTVSTKRGRIIYPPVFEEENPLHLPYPMEIAAGNYTLMNEGLLLDLNLTLEHNTALSNVLLIFYILISVLILNQYYRSGLNKTRKEEQEKEKEINRLLYLEKKYLNSLADLAKAKEGLTSEYALIKNQYEDVIKSASRNEDEMIEEIMALEEQINRNLARQKQRQDEIDTLTEKLSRYEKEKPKINIRPQRGRY